MANTIAVILAAGKSKRILHTRALVGRQIAVDLLEKLSRIRHDLHTHTYIFFLKSTKR